MKVKPFRRAFQVGFILLLILVAYYSQNPWAWSPSRIALGELPPPRVTSVWGDSWSLTIAGITFNHPLAVVEAVVATKALYITAVVGMLIPLLITLVLGRVFCSWLCPVGFLLELNQNIRALVRKKTGITIKTGDYRYKLLIISVALTFLLATPVISAFDPPHVFGREIMNLMLHHTLSLGGIIILGGIFVVELFSDRIWCRNFCPAGGFLSFLGRKRVVKIKKKQEKCILCGECNLACPYNIRPVELGIEKEVNEETCDNCGLCRDACPAHALHYAIGR